MVTEVQNFINGKFVKSAKYLDSYEPATGKVWAKVPDAGKKEVDEAVAAAKQAFESWSNTSVDDRAKVLVKIAEQIEKNLKHLAEVESKDQGKNIGLASAADIPGSAKTYRDIAGIVPHILGKSKISKGGLHYTTHNPIGVAALITPWNFPLLVLSFKLSAALITGNTVVIKPSEMTSVSTYEFSKLLNDAGVPAGVVNIVYGNGPTAGQELISHKDVAVISFTGSTATGNHIAQVAAKANKKVGLEMGGKNPSVVFSDANLQDAVPGHIRSSFFNQGEVCVCGSRVYVQREIYKDFVSELVKEAEKLKIGPSSEEGNFLGPVNSKVHYNKVQSYIQEAIKDGGKVECGETVKKVQVPKGFEEGYYILPTVITGVKESSKSMKEEIFGPVVMVQPFDTEEEAIKKANDTTYGLSATVWTKDGSRAQRVANKLDAGSVWINSWLLRDDDFPFGGYKNSGLGREGNYDSFFFFTQEKTISTKFY